MGKKKGDKSKGYQSKGERSNVSRWVKKAARKEYMANYLARSLNQINALLKGKKVMVTIPNPNTNETNKRFIRVSAKDVWKNSSKYSMKTVGEES